MAVALLADLGHLQFHGSRVQAGSHRKAAEIQPLHHQVLAEGPVDHIGPPLVKILYLIIG